jgi:hypothetical protein
MFFPFYDPTFILLIPAIVLALWAQHLVRSTFNKYSRIAAAVGLTGGAVAERLLQDSGLNDVTLEEVEGKLTDHYDPRTKTLRLSGSEFGFDFGVSAFLYRFFIFSIFDCSDGCRHYSFLRCGSLSCHHAAGRVQCELEGVNFAAIEGLLGGKGGRAGQESAPGGCAHIRCSDGCGCPSSVEDAHSTGQQGLSF